MGRRIKCHHLLITFALLSCMIVPSILRPVGDIVPCMTEPGFCYIFGGKVDEKDLEAAKNETAKGETKGGQANNATTIVGEKTTTRTTIGGAGRTTSVAITTTTSPSSNIRNTTLKVANEKSPRGNVKSAPAPIKMVPKATSGVPKATTEVPKSISAVTVSPNSSRKRADEHEEFAQKTTVKPAVRKVPKQMKALAKPPIKPPKVPISIANVGGSNNATTTTTMASKRPPPPPIVTTPKAPSKMRKFKDEKMSKKKTEANVDGGAQKAEEQVKTAVRKETKVGPIPSNNVHE